MTQIVIVITSEVVSKSIKYIVRVSFTNWLCLTSLNHVIRLIYYQLKSNRGITQSQENPKYKWLKIILVSIVGVFLNGIIPYISAVFLDDFSYRMVVIVVITNLQMIPFGSIETYIMDYVYQEKYWNNKMNVCVCTLCVRLWVVIVRTCLCMHAWSLGSLVSKTYVKETNPLTR